MSLIEIPCGPYADWDAWWERSAARARREEELDKIRQHYSNDQLMLPDPDLAWRPFATAPDVKSRISWFEVLHPVTGHVYRIHYAQDFSGEYQAPFRGYFDERFVEIEFEPKFWREIQEH